MTSSVTCQQTIMTIQLKRYLQEASKSNRQYRKRSYKNTDGWSEWSFHILRSSTLVLIRALTPHHAMTKECQESSFPVFFSSSTDLSCYHMFSFSLFIIRPRNDDRLFLMFVISFLCDSAYFKIFRLIIMAVQEIFHTKCFLIVAAQEKFIRNVYSFLMSKKIFITNVYEFLLSKKLFKTNVTSMIT